MSWKHGKIYLDSANRWRYLDSGKLAPNPHHKRCSKTGCYNIVRNSSDLCSKHVDWSKKAHGRSILDDSDVLIISENYDSKSDQQITALLSKRKAHSSHSNESLLVAVRHHRRKYLIFRYGKKFYYKTIKLKYGKQNFTCQICNWDEGTIDIHHIWQICDFKNEADYHKEDNLISLCPNHYRKVEELRKKNKKLYREI